MTDGLLPTDATRKRDHDPHLEDDATASDTFLAGKKAEHDRQEADKAAWDKSAALFSAKLPFAGPAVAALCARYSPPPATPSALSKDEARALMAHANQTLALYGGNVRPLPTPPVSNPVAPPAALSSEQALALRVAAERHFQTSMRSGALSPDQRAAQDSHLRALEHAAAERSDDPALRKAALYEDLARLGDTKGCSAHDTVDSLTARRDALLAARAGPANDDDRIYMGAHGEQGTADAVAREEAAAHWQESLGELDAIQSGPVGATASLVGRALGLSDEKRQALAQAGGALDGVMLAFGGAQESESDRLVERVDDIASTLTERRGEGLTHDQVLSLAFDYKRVVESDKEWHWYTNIPDGNRLTELDKSTIRNYARDAGLVPRVPMKPGTRFADFGRAGLVIQTERLPKELWGKSEASQSAWLDARIPGGRPTGTTWHHDDEPGVMQLVPFGIHYVNSHDGGCSPGQWSEGTRKRR